MKKQVFKISVTDYTTVIRITIMQV